MARKRLEKEEANIKHPSGQFAALGFSLSLRRATYDVVVVTNQQISSSAAAAGFAVVARAEAEAEREAEAEAEANWSSKFATLLIARVSTQARLATTLVLLLANQRNCASPSSSLN